MENKSHSRNSNIELLKIIAMFLICVSHVYNASGFSNVLSTNLGDVFTVMLKNGGWIGDVIFITCSVYFLYGKEKTLNLRKIFIYYISSALIFFVYLGIFCLIGIEVPRDIMINTFDTLIVTDYWFIFQYIIYLALFPLLAFITDKINQKVHFVFVIAALAFAITNLVLRQLGLYEFGLTITFYTIFIIVTYGKKYGHYLFLKDGKENLKKNSIILCILLGLWFLTTILCSLIYPLIGLGKVEMTDINYIHSPIMYLIGIDLFLIFKNIDIETSKTINYISSLSLIFYIMHHNKYTQLVIDPNIHNFIMNDREAFRPLIILGSGTIIFVVAILVSIIYKETIHRLVVMIGKYIPNISLEKKNKIQKE